MIMPRPTSNAIWLVLAATLGVIPSADAHLMNTGFGPFYDGLTHLFVTPEDLLPVIALAFLAGLRGPRFGRAVARRTDCCFWLMAIIWPTRPKNGSLA